MGTFRRETRWWAGGVRAAHSAGGEAPLHHLDVRAARWTVGGHQRSAAAERVRHRRIPARSAGGHDSRCVPHVQAGACCGLGASVHDGAAKSLCANACQFATCSACPRRGTAPGSQPGLLALNVRLDQLLHGLELGVLGVPKKHEHDALRARDERAALAHALAKKWESEEPPRPAMPVRPSNAPPGQECGR